MHIRREIELFLRRTDMAATCFGRKVANDPRLVLDIRNGREVRSAMERKIRRFIAGFGAPCQFPAAPPRDQAHAVQPG